jgi:hypothetical protein
MGGTGNIRTLRNQSGSNGSRTLGSILASDGTNGAGSNRRVYTWYIKNSNIQTFFKQVYGFSWNR